MKKTLQASILILLAGAALAQQRIELKTQASPRVTVDTTAPTTCTVGDIFVDTNATSGQQIYLATATGPCTWTLQGDGGGAGATAVTDLSDLSVVRTNATTLTVGTDCLTTAPCLVRVGNSIYSFEDGPITLSAPTVTSGTVWLGVNASTGALTAWHNFTALTCGTGITCSSGATGFPAGSVPIWQWSGVSDAFEATGGVDQRAMLGRERAAIAGTGISISDNPNGAQTISLDLPAASDTASGGVELATAAETTTGTDATRAVTPDGLAGSVFGLERIGGECIADATALTVADGKCYFPIPASLNGAVVEAVEVFLGAAVSSSGAVTVDIDRCGAVATGIRCSGTNVSIFSTLATIDANESKTSTAATASVINASNDDLATGDYLRVNVDGAGTGTQGLYVWVNVRVKP